MDRIKVTRKASVVIQILLLIFICVINAVGTNHYANFYPINGTYQNFNPVRRLLDGQVVYRDFVDYLGLGHLFMGALCTFIFGGTYQASLYAFSFLTLLSAAACSATLGYFICKRADLALAITNLSVIICKSLFANGIRSVYLLEFYPLYKAAFFVGTSARLVRAMILPLSCLLLCISYNAGRALIKKYDLSADRKKMIILTGMSFISALSVLWSNDYGLSGCVCLTVMIFITVLSRKRKIISACIFTAAELLLSFFWILIITEIVSLGHTTGYFRYMFGTGDYQRWYFGFDKSYYIYDVDFSRFMLLQAAVTIIYLFMIWKNHGETSAVFRYGVPAFINMSCFCAANEYKLLSGDLLQEAALIVLFFTALYEIIAFILSRSKLPYLKAAVTVVSLIVSVAWIVSECDKEADFSFAEEKDGKYFEQLGGNVVALSSDLERTAEFLKDERYFATYASAQEVLSGIYQPSGTDYIIHVLGDERRKEYLDSFRTEDFRYAATIKESYNPYEFWIMRANWFFYKELYRYYHPVYGNTYEIYWERNTHETEDILTGDFEVTVDDINDSVKEIVVRADENVNGVADLFIEYDVEKKNSFNSKFVFQTMLKVENADNFYSSDNSFEANLLRSEGKEYIPVPIVNGYGRVRLTSCPYEDTELTLNAAHCTDIYPVSYRYIEIGNISEQSSSSLTVTAENNKRNTDMLENAAAIIINEKSYSITDIDLSEDHIYISVDNENGDDYKELSGNFVRLRKNNE